jgi:hypothetical protein
MPAFGNRLAEAEKGFRQLSLLALLYLLPAAQAMLPIDDTDIWWHLRTGQWIIQHGTVPFSDPFSGYGEPKSWFAYSWLFEIIIYKIFSFFGLVGLTLFTVMFGLLIALALHALVRRANLPFLYGVVITAMGLVCMKPLMSPRPWLFSVLFFIWELIIIFDYRRSGSLRRLFWLPLIFVVWANVHVQFIYGLAVLFLTATAPFLQSPFKSHPSAHDQGFKPSLSLFVVTGVCILATLVNPYHLLIYRPIIDYAAQTQVFDSVAELHPLLFRSPVEWIFLALTLGAAFFLGWRRETDLFPFGLLGMGAFLAFRARRDIWVGTVAAVAVISYGQITPRVTERLELSRAKVVFVALIVGIALLFVARSRGITEAVLQAHVAQRFPVEAVAFVKKNNIRGPLYNHFDWGGFLIWSLPEIPVSMDGRTNLYGGERIEKALAVWSGSPDWNSDPELGKARLIIAEGNRPLISLLRRDARFELIYEDRVAAVFAAGAQGTKNR